MEINKIKATYNPGSLCNIQRHSFDWTVLLENGTDLEFDNYYNMETFIIEPYTIGAGDHFIIVQVNEYDEQGDAGTVTSEICQFNVRVTLPVPQITGGSEITVSSGSSFKVDGSSSIDMSVPTDEEGNLFYKWNCEVSDPGRSDFCKRNLGSGASVVIPSSYGLDGLSYTFTLSVRTSLTDWQSTKQTIHFKQGAPVIEMKCLKNCLPAVMKTNSKESLILEAVCLKNCDKIKPEMYEWSVDDPSFDYGSSTKDGRNTDIFYVKENVLTVGKKYKVSVKLKGLAGSSSMEIKVHKPPKLDSCSINPGTGEALKTEFLVECNYEEGNYMFELYSVKNNLDVLLDRGVKLKDMAFLLSPGSKVKVKMFDDYRFSDSKMLDVTVIPSLKDTNAKELDEEIESKYFDKEAENSLDSLMKEKKFDGVLQAASSLADELSDVKETEESKDIIKKYQVQLLEYLEKVPIDNSDRARQLTAVVTKIVAEHADKPDPDIAALGTNICKEAAKEDEVRLKNERFPQSFSEEVKENTEVLTKCSQASVTPNLEIMQTEDFPDPTTPFPVLDVPVVVENYPDYVDDQNISKFRKNFATASDNLIDICYLNTKSLEMTMVLEEEAKSVKSDVFEVTVMKDVGSAILKEQLESQGVTLVASKDFSSSKSEVVMSMCTSKKNPFWWIQKEEVPTSVAIVQFRMDDATVHEFQRPFFISFEIGNLSPPIETHESTTPRKPIGNLSQTEYDFEKISMHRIDVERNQGFVVEFLDLSEGNILDVRTKRIPRKNTIHSAERKISNGLLFQRLKLVVITDLYKPSYEEFKKLATQVTKNNSKIYTAHDRNFDSWYYLGVLPNSKMGNQETKYKFSIYTTACYSWSSELRNWEPACGSTRNSNITHITCECYHSSTLSGRIVTNKVREEVTLYVDLELEFQACFIIFISVALVFFVYCLLFICLTICPISELVEKAVYFVADVPSHFRYGYLIIVRTANKINAGTTSNVMVKLYGQKSESIEHVLNYPDPEKRLLRRDQEDWFFLATENHLGDINKIDVWFDSIGYRPSWYCSKIEVVDVQQNKYWSFDMNKRFDVLRKEEVIHTAVPENPTVKKSKWKVFSKIVNSFHGPHMWNIITYKDPTFSRMKRLTIMFSIFMTTYTIGMFLYGCPRLENSDSLAYTTQYAVHTHVVFITIGCFMFTFAIHFPLVWYFRRSKKTESDESKKGIKWLLKDVNFLCWCFLIFNITLAMTLLVIFGFWVPCITSLLWLTSVVVSLLVYIFLLENIVRLINNLLMPQEARVNYILNQAQSAIAYASLQRSILYKKFGTNVLRPFLSHLYKPLDAAKITERKYWMETKEKVLEILEDLVMITIYVLLLYLVILQDKDPYGYLSNREVAELIGGIHSRSIELEEIHTKAELQEYLEDTLIASMQSPQWYGKFVTQNPGMTIDNANKYIGISRLRQHRARNDTCVVPKRMRNVTETCYPGYSDSPDYRDFSEEWKDDNYSDKFARMDGVWKYRSSAGTFGDIGKFASYPGGGYIATTGRMMKNSLINTKYLFRNGWIDELSRSIFIEFLLYSANSNLFNSVTIWFEISGVGYVRSKFQVQTAKLLFVKEETSTMVVVIFLCFLVMVIILATKLFYSIIRKRKLIFRDTWHLVDMLIILMTVGCVLLYVHRSEMVKIFLSKIEKSKHNEFINYFHLLFAENILTLLAAILIFIATLRLWKLLRFLLIVKIVEKTLVLSAAPLLCLLLCHMVIILCFMFTGILLFGDLSYDFQNNLDAFATVLLFAINFKSDFDLGIINNTLAFIYYSVYMIVTLVYLTLYVTVITICYEEAQLFYSNTEGYTVPDYLREQYDYYSELARIRWKNARLRAGDDETRQNGNVYPKADEHRYADCLTVPSNKLTAMGMVTKCVLRNMKKGSAEQITDADADLIKGTVVNLFREDSDKTNIFFMGKDEHGKMKVVDDATLVKMEKLVGALLKEDKKQDDGGRQKEIYQKIVARQEKQLGDTLEHLKILLDTTKNINLEAEDGGQKKK